MGGKKAKAGSAKNAVTIATSPVMIAPELLGDLRSLIEASRSHVAQVVNSAMVLTYWGVGDRIRRDVVGQERAEYGKQLVAKLAEALRLNTGRDSLAPTCSTCCASPRFFRIFKLSRHCLDN